LVPAKNYTLNVPCEDYVCCLVSSIMIGINLKPKYWKEE